MDMSNKTEHHWGREDGLHVVGNLTQSYLTEERESSLYAAFLFILIGLAAFLIALFSRNTRKPMKCNLKVKSCYVSYGSTNLVLPKIGESKWYQKLFYMEDLDKKGRKGDKMLFPKCPYRKCFKSSKIVSVSDLWKAKSRQSNNYFVINIIPEEDEGRGDKA